jgi:hypothetical protein
MLNYEGIGKPLAIIVDEEIHHDKKKRSGKRNDSFNKIVSVAEDFDFEKVINLLRRIDLQKGQIFQQMPNEKDIVYKLRRRILYISGKSGSGKSYYTADYVRGYLRETPKNRVILFSALDEDDTLDEITGVKRVKVNTPGFCNEEFKVEQFKDMLVIFDDTDTIEDIRIKNKLAHIAKFIQQTGRHTDTTLVYTSHLSCAGNDTKLILTESHSVIFFPSAMTIKSLKYLCQEYIGLDIKQIKHVNREKSRWLTYFKGCPPLIMTKYSLCFVVDYGQTPSEPEKLEGGCGSCAEVAEPKPKSNDKYVCSCGANVLYRNKYRHELTAKHKKNLK